MKRLYKKLLLLLVLALCLTSCGQMPKEPAEPGITPQTTPTISLETIDEIPPREDERTVITLSVMNPYNISHAVTAFNNANPDYYVEIITCPEGVSAQDYWARETLEIMAGNGPDIFTKNQQSTFMTYVNKGVIEDLAPYIERDIQVEKYLPESLYAYEYNGKVYGIESDFTLSLLVGSKEIFGDTTGWTLEEAMEIMEQSPELLAFDNMGTPGYILKRLLSYGNVAINDYTTIRSCMEFDKMYSKALPADTPAIPGQTILVVQELIKSPIAWADMEALYAQELTPIGFINEQQEGIRHESTAWSINAASENKEGAWEFLKFLLSEEYQRQKIKDYQSFGFSPLKSLVEEQLEFYSKPLVTTSYVDPDTGETVVYTQAHPLSRAMCSPYSSAGEIEYMSEEQLQMIETLIERSKINCFSWDEIGRKIISEEAQVYFNDGCTLDDAMRNIQNRIDLYVSETQ